MSKISHRPMRYIVAVLSVALALGAVHLPMVGPKLIGILFCSIFFSAWYGGLGPGLAATAIIVATVVVGLARAHGRNFPLMEVLPLAQSAVIGVLISVLTEALHVSRQRASQNQSWLSAVLRSIGDAVIAVDPSGRITFFNGVAEALTGWPMTEAIGKPLDDVFRIIDEDTRGPLQEPVAPVPEHGSVEGAADHRILIARDGEERPIADSAAPIRSKDGRVIGVVIVFRDVGDRRRTEMALDQLNHELRENDRRKDEFLAMLAHELRNPLAAIGNAVALASQTPRREQIGWSLEVATRQVRHLSRLIDDLLDVSRITRGNIELRRGICNTATILEHAVEMASPLIEKRKHELILRIDDDLWIDADAARLEQVVVNLLNNAAKYTEDGSRIWLSASRDQDEVVIAVRDSGIGIPPERLPAMFELFTQADRSLARSEGGLGIGLTVVKTLVEMHGGRIVATSAGNGLGCEFTVRIPAAESPVPAELPPEIRPEVPRERSSRILVVDDNVDTARTLSRILTLIGHDVSTAYNGPDAIEAARRHRPEFILLDIGLPGMDGYEVTSTLREESWCRDVTIIAVSGYGGDDDRRRSKDAGFDHHLVKPVDCDALVSLLKSPGPPLGPVMST